jgi:hypothetical protein
MLQVCETIYGCERAAKLQAYIEGAMGQPCPCKQGLGCPMMPVDNLDETPVRLPLPRLRGEVGRVRVTGAAALAAYGVAAMKVTSAVL